MRNSESFLSLHYLWTLLRYIGNAIVYSTLKVRIKRVNTKKAAYKELVELTKLIVPDCSVDSV